VPTMKPPSRGGSRSWERAIYVTYLAMLLFVNDLSRASRTARTAQVASRLARSHIASNDCVCFGV
jgi:hypothetical protein